MSEATLNPPNLEEINCALAETVAEEMTKNEELRIALEESVKLQSHYAELLNAWDGGKRLAFSDADAWIARLRVCERIRAR